MWAEIFFKDQNRASKVDGITGKNLGHEVAHTSAPLDNQWLEP
jgi:hypothetical protein